MQLMDLLVTYFAGNVIEGISMSIYYTQHLLKGVAWYKILG